jgi:hypothetical protein
MIKKTVGNTFRNLVNAPAKGRITPGYKMPMPIKKSPMPIRKMPTPIKKMPIKQMPKPKMPIDMPKKAMPMNEGSIKRYATRSKLA